MSLNKIVSLLVGFIAMVVILMFSQGFLMPIIIAFLLWFLVRKAKTVMDKIGFVKRYFPSWIKNLLTSLILFSIIGVVAEALLISIGNLADSYSVYEANVSMVTNELNLIFNIDIAQLIKSWSTGFDFGEVLSMIFNSIKNVLGNTFMILLYALFIFLEESSFIVKMKAIFPEESQYLYVTEIIERIENSISNYIGLKTLVSIITGVLSYVVLLLIGIDSPVFWACLIFLLNFIPTIGSLVATLFPAAFSILQFGTFTPALMVLLFIGGIQLLVGNILEPKLMGDSLNISSLVTIIALSFWGFLWGVSGMIISIPITVIMVIVFSQFSQTKPIAILLSSEGKV